MLVDVKCKTPECPAPVEEILIKRADVEPDGRIREHQCPVCGQSLFKPTQPQRTSFALVGKWFANGGY